MQISYSGQKPEKHPSALSWGECYFEDMWGHWTVYKDCHHVSFQGRVQKFVESSKYSSSNSFNDNYIVAYFQGK